MILQGCKVTSSENNADAVPNAELSGHAHDREIPALKRRLNKPLGIVLFLCGGALVWLALMNALNENRAQEQETIVEQQAESQEYVPAGVPNIVLPDPDPFVYQPVPPPETAQKQALAGIVTPAAPVDDSEAEVRKQKAAEVWARKNQGQILTFNQSFSGGGGFIKTSSGSPLEVQANDLLAEGERLKAELRSMRNRNARPPDAAMRRDVDIPRVAQARALHLKDPDFTLVEGKVIGAILETAVQSDAVGKLRALSTEPVYGYNGKRLLIPQGSRFIGEYQTALKHGRTRLFAIWTRAITPDNISINLDSPGIGPLGRAGMSGYVDSHFWERFGASLMLSIIGSAVADTDDRRVQSVSRDFHSSAAIALESSINIPPTFHKHHGERIRIFVAHDINFRNLYDG